MPGGTIGVSGDGGVGSGVDCVTHTGGGATVPLSLECVWGFCAVPFVKGR